MKRLLSALRSTRQTTRVGRRPRRQERLLALPLEDALAASGVFDLPHYAALTGITAGAAHAVRHYLAEGTRSPVAPHPEFDRDEYLDFYPDVRAAGVDPFVHYALHGQFEARAPSRRRAFEDAAVMAEAGLFDFAGYRQRYGLDGSDDDLLFHYVTRGALDGASPFARFDESFIRTYYERLLVGSTSPFAFFCENKGRPWCFPNPGAAQAAVRLVQRTGAFDVAFYRRTTLADRPGLDPLLHYVSEGYITGAVPCEAFRPAQYCEANTDIRWFEIDPLVHYQTLGRNEHRGGGAAAPVEVTPGGRALDPALPTILLVTHDAGRTGAPFVALNLLRSLSAGHNVVTWIGGAGALEASFREASIAAVQVRIEPANARKVVETLRQNHRFAFAVVNSVASTSCLPALVDAEVPVVSLVHEYAEYVFPIGTMAAAALRSDAVVMPAEPVLASARAEFAALQRPAAMQRFVVRHQGRCDTAAEGSAGRGLGRPEILARLGLAPDAALPFIVFGAGYVQPRKGLDLFVDVARQVVARFDGPCRFVWVGGGFHGGPDPTYGAFIRDQVRKSGLEDQVVFFEEQPGLDAFWDLADCFLLSSQLDPFPNVVLDAIANRVPVVCFEGTTGAVTLAAHGGPAVTSVPYRDAAAAADAIVSLATSADAVAAALAAEAPLWDERLSFPRYAAFVAGLGHDLAGAAPPPARPLPVDPAAFAIAMPTWALAADRGRIRTRDALEADLRISAAAGDPYLAPLDGPVPATVVRTEAAFGPPSARLRARDRSSVVVHLHVAEAGAVDRAARAAALAADLEVVVTTPLATVADEMARALASLPHATIRQDPACLDAALGFLTVLADHAAARVIGTFAPEPPRPSVEEPDWYGDANRLFLMNAAIGDQIVDAMLADPAIRLAYLAIPTVLGDDVLDAALARLASTLGLGTPDPATARHRPADWAFWISPALYRSLDPGRIRAGLLAASGDFRNDLRRRMLAVLSAGLALRDAKALEIVWRRGLRRAGPRYLECD